MGEVRKNFSQKNVSVKRSSQSSQIVQTKDENSNMVPAEYSPMSKNWMLLRKWMMPKLFEDNFSSMPDMKDSNLISMKNDDSKMEISLNTAGYKPSELKVNVADGEISIEGKHEEKSEEGHTMVSRQFSRRYTLPQEAKLTEVVSNLSQDGVMVITVPKEKKIEEVKENQKMKVEHKTSVGTKEKASSSESLIPMTMRDSFFDDPFFEDNRLDIETSQKNFFEKSRKSFEESLISMESSIIGSNMFDTKQSSLLSNDWGMPKIFGQDSDSIFNSKDSNLIRMVNDDSKMEISLDTTGYKPDELKISAGQGLICVEVKHEEKSEAGQVMVARQFSRKYSLPAGARAEEVVSNLSQDGVLVISVPKREAIQQENRSVPIAVK